MNGRRTQTVVQSRKKARRANAGSATRLNAAGYFRARARARHEK